MTDNSEITAKGAAQLRLATEPGDVQSMSDLARRGDEEKLIGEIKESYQRIEAIYYRLSENRRKPEYQADDEVGKQVKEFRNGIHELLFVLDGLFFEVDGQEHIELNWAKSFANSFDQTCLGLLRLLDNAAFLDPILKEAHENSDQKEKKIENLRDCIRTIKNDFGDLQLVRRSEAEENDLWDQYTQDAAGPDTGNGERGMGNSFPVSAR